MHPPSRTVPCRRATHPRSRSRPKASKATTHRPTQADRRLRNNIPFKHRARTRTRTRNTTHTRLLPVRPAASTVPLRDARARAVLPRSTSRSSNVAYPSIAHRHSPPSVATSTATAHRASTPRWRRSTGRRAMPRHAMARRATSRPTRRRQVALRTNPRLQLPSRLPLLAHMDPTGRSSTRPPLPPRCAANCPQRMCSRRSSTSSISRRVPSSTTRGIGRVRRRR